MNKLLMEKIEELMLYSIKQNKEIQKLKLLESKYSQLNKKIESLEKLISKGLNTEKQ